MIIDKFTPCLENARTGEIVQTSFDLGYGGYIFMDAKNIELVAHYRRTLGAVLLGRPHPYRMFVDEDAAQKLLKIYTFEEGK